MFRSFFLNRRWWQWSVLGTLTIFAAIWYRVQLDVQINEWFGGFYDTIQKALAKPGAVTFEEILGYLWTFAGIAGVAIVAAVILEFFLRHYVFRWRTAMNDYYVANWQRLRHILEIGRGIAGPRVSHRFGFRGCACRCSAKQWRRFACWLSLAWPRLWPAAPR